MWITLYWQSSYYYRNKVWEKDLTMPCNDYKKTNLLIAGSLDMFGVSDNIKSLLVNSMEEWWYVHGTTYGFSESKDNIIQLLRF